MIQRLRLIAVATCLVALAPSLRASDDDPQNRTVPPMTSPAPLTVGGKFRYYLRATYGPTSFATAAASAGLNQARDHPEEWGQGAEGYGRRYASKFGQNVVKRTVQFGVGAARGEDPRYYRSELTGFGPRMKYAVSRIAVVRMDDGRQSVAAGRLVGAFAGGLVSRTWQPERDRNVSSGLGAGAISLGIDAGFQVLHEFWPDIRRIVFRR